MYKEYFTGLVIGVLIGTICMSMYLPNELEVTQTDCVSSRHSVGAQHRHQ